VDFVEPKKIQIAPIHNVDGAGLHNQIVQNVHVVDCAFGYDHYGRNVAAQTQKCMKLYRPLALPEFRPGKSARQRSIVVESKEYTA